MRLCKIQAAGESEPVNQALRHRPVVGQILFFDLLVYAPGAAVGFRCEINRPKEETQNGTGFGRVEFRWLLPRAPTSIEDGPDVLQQIINGVRFDAQCEPANYNWRIHAV